MYKTTNQPHTAYVNNPHPYIQAPYTAYDAAHHPILMQLWRAVKMVEDWVDGHGLNIEEGKTLIYGL
jgi:hypothetical protein